MRELTGHRVNGVNEGLMVYVKDDPSDGGASHVYEITWASRGAAPNFCTLHFQKGTLKEVGTNGVTQEALLAVLIDRLEGFQSGKFACEENAAALTALRFAQAILRSRTEKRLARGVEGTHQV